jgi:hypothetical protein
MRGLAWNSDPTSTPGPDGNLWITKSGLDFHRGL